MKVLLGKFCDRLSITFMSQHTCDPLVVIVIFSYLKRGHESFVFILHWPDNKAADSYTRVGTQGGWRHGTIPTLCLSGLR